MNALDLLQQDHERIRDLLRQVSDADSAKCRQKLFMQLGHELVEHTRMEEEVLHPALDQLPASHDLLPENYLAHREWDIRLQEMASFSPGTGRWNVRFAALRDAVEQHMREEEQNLFSLARQAWGNDLLSAMGRKMHKLKTGREKSLACRSK